MDTEKFDFGNIGKRMPYTMPPDTFDEMEANVFARMKEDKRSTTLHRFIRWGSVSAIAAAASVALLLTIKPARMTQDEQLSLIDMAYANLSEEDQDFLMETYQEDVFINQEQK